MATKKISELPAVSDMNESDLFIVSQGSGSTYGSLKATLVGIAKKILTNIQYASELQTSDKTITGAINEVNQYAYMEFADTLTAGSTSLTISDASITTSLTLDNVYTSVFGINPTNVVIRSGAVVLTFEAQQSDIDVKVRLSNGLV